MDLKAVIGFLLATAFVAAGIYADYRARKLRMTGQMPHLPDFEWWPVPAMPVKVMAILLTAMSAVGIVFYEMHLVAPNPTLVDTQISFNAFICLGLIGLSCLFDWKSLQSQVAGGLSLIWSAMSVADSLHPFGFSTLILDPKEAHDAFVAPLAGLTFAIGAGISLMLGRAMSNRPLRYATGFLGVMMFFYGVLALLGYAVGNTVVLQIADTKPVPAATALLIMVMGSGFSSLIYHDHVREWSKDELSTAINSLTALTILGALMTAMHVFMAPIENTGIGALLIIGLLFVCTGAVGFVSLRRAMVRPEVVVDAPAR